MSRPIKRIVFGLVATHVLTYVFLSDLMMERKACDKFLQFTERRFANPYNQNVSESIFISSCGDEFFRDLTRLVDAAHSSNPEYGSESINNWDSFGENDFNQSFRISPYPQIDILGTISENTDSLETSNCILFELCSTKSIPCFLRRVEYSYFYSSHPTDFHIMMYTDRGLKSRPTYVWLLFNWIEWNGELINAFE